VSRVSWRTSALESSAVDVTHFTTSATMSTGGGLTTLVLTGGLKTGLMRNTLKNQGVNINETLIK